LAEELLGRVRKSLAGIFATDGKRSRGSLSNDEHQAVDTLLVFLAQEEEGEALQRGRHAKKAKADGGEVPVAKVSRVREIAELLGMSPSTTHRRDDPELKAYWLATRTLLGHRHSDEVKRMVLEFYVAHP